MSRKQKRNFFHLFKGGKDDKGTTPLHGAPNTNLDTYDKRNGRFKSRRKFGKDGNAFVDLDTKHTCGVDYDHAHDINVKNKKQPRSSEHRKLTRKERREVNKAKRKRKGWNNGY
ncbi:MAG: hypothetical protein K2L12_02525 [Clostridia bacterium]|nr:hypothetical protein [Clostridia bacterium]